MSGDTRTIEIHPERLAIDVLIEGGTMPKELARRFKVPLSDIEIYRKEYLKAHPSVVEALAQRPIEPHPIPQEEPEATGNTVKPPVTRDEQARAILDTLNPLFVEKKTKLKSPLPPLKITPLLKARFREHCILLNVRIPAGPEYLKALRKWGQAQAELQARNEESRREALGVVAGDDTGIFPYWGSPSHISAFKEARKPPRDYFLERYNR